MGTQDSCATTMIGMQTPPPLQVLVDDERLGQTRHFR